MELTVQPFSRSLTHPLVTANGTITERRGFRLELTDGDITGLGEATPLAGWTESYDRCKQTLRAASGHCDQADLQSLFRDRTEPAARHGLQLAVADYRAKQAGKPLAATLDTGVSAPVTVNATVGAGSTAETVTAVSDALEAGYETIKLKVGTDQWTADRDRVQTVLAQLPAGAHLRLDVNGQWSEQTARQACEWLSSYEQLEYIEQPLAAGQLDGHRRLRDLGVSVAIDEGLREFSPATVLEAQAADVLVCKPMVLGGIDRAQQAIDRARAAGHTATVTTTVDGMIAQAAAVHLAAAYQPLPACGLATDELLVENNNARPFTQRGDTMIISEHPGIGVDGS